MDKSAAKSQWSKRLRFNGTYFHLRRVLLKCNLRPFAISITIPLLYNWFTAIFLFSKLTDFNFPGNSGMVSHVCGITGHRV